MVVYGEADDSPGGQLLGVVAIIVGVVGIIRSGVKRSTKIITAFALGLIVSVAAWAPWLYTTEKTMSLVSLGGPTCDYVISKWRPFGRYGDSCGTRWSLSFFGEVLREGGKE